MSNIGADVFAEWGVVPEYVVPMSVFLFVSYGWFCVECTSIRICLVLFGMEEQLSQRMLCGMKGMTVFCVCWWVCSLWWLVGG